MPTRRLPAHPDPRHLRIQAKDLLKGYAAGDVAVFQRIREFHPRFASASDDAIRSAPFTLSDAYLSLAREYGFASWARLLAALPTSGADLQKPHHERIDDPLFRRAVDLIDDGDSAVLGELLREQPALVHQRVTFEGENYFTHPYLLEFVAENPIRNDSLPPNIAEVAETIIAAGAPRRAITSTLTLVCSGRVARECGAQLPMIDLLCSHGADVNEAMLPALAHDESAAAEALIRHGATVDIVVAAALGRTSVVRAALPSAEAISRHRALALAAQRGHAEIVALLLDAGEDPNRYNPAGCHAHSTPLHQAAGGGHLEVVRTLVEHGARVNLRDTLFNGTPLGWAEYGGRGEVAEYLRGVR